uniref:Uncharacterized protein n=1 Tax=Knipowitschia caucasica TaxID=637954 RepID=A0AAV2JLV3_KNICA
MCVSLGPWLTMGAVLSWLSAHFYLLLLHKSTPSTHLRRARRSLEGSSLLCPSRSLETGILCPERACHRRGSEGGPHSLITSEDLKSGGRTFLSKPRKRESVTAKDFLRSREGDTEYNGSKRTQTPDMDLKLMRFAQAHHSLSSVFGNREGMEYGEGHWIESKQPWKRWKKVDGLKRTLSVPNSSLSRSRDSAEQLERFCHTEPIPKQGVPPDMEVGLLRDFLFLN